MWPFKKKNAPKLEFSERMYRGVNNQMWGITVIHSGSVVYGHIKETDYGVWQIELCGSKAARLSYGDAIKSVREKWNEWYK